MDLWTHEQRVRLAFEEKILRNEMPDFWWEDRITRGATKVKGYYTSSADNFYKICIWIRANYPDTMPDMYIISPSPLRGYGRTRISSYGTSHDMHVWESDWNDYVKICHWKDEYWSSSNTILGVLMKGFLWLEALEVHRRTGRSIDAYSLSF